MRHVGLLKKSLASGQLPALSTRPFSIHRRPASCASMASASSDSGLYRTTSGSTASSSGSYAMDTTASTSATASPRGKLHGSASRSSLHDAQDASMKQTKRARRRRKPGEGDVTVAPVSSPSCLPGFVTATSLTSNRGSPALANPVATNMDVKGKSREKDSPSDPQPRRLEDSLPHALNADTNSSLDPSAIQQDSTGMRSVYSLAQSGDRRKTVRESPEDSAASSTDEMPYAPSPTVSPQVTPQSKATAKVAQAASVTPKSSPFKPPLTGFEFLAARNLAVFGAPISTMAGSPGTGGLGIVANGLESMPVKESEPSTRPSVQRAASAPSEATKKKIAASPLTWSTDHKALDAPTLGSPTLGSMRAEEDAEEVTLNAITKAAFSVNQVTILQELAKRKAQRKLEIQEAIHAQRGPASEAQPEAAETTENQVEEAGTDNNHDGVKRRDMVVPQWQPLSPPSNARFTAQADSNVRLSTSALDRSPLVGDGTMSATADIEEEIDDGASDVSNTSFLVRSVARDGDLSRGWEDLDSGYTTREKARQRLQKSMYQLNKRHRPSPAVIAARREMLAAIRKRLNNMLKDYTPNFQYRLETFGSTAYGLDTDTSDLDLCIVDPHRPEGFRNASDLYDLSTRFSNDGKVEALATTEEDEENAASTPFSRHKRNKKWAEPEIRKRLSLGEIYDVHRLANALRNMRYQQVIAIPNAIVPIVKFKSQEGIKADMNPNEQLGVRNSKLLAEYISLKPIIRPFLIFLKVWAKQRHLNDPSGQKGLMSLSSYSLVLMAIGYLQHAEVVPNLQDANLIAKHGVEREIFWSKVPNPDAPKASHWVKRKFLGDYRAMAIDTTFVKAEQLDLGNAVSSVLSATHPSSSPAAARRLKNKKSGSVGWGSESDASVTSSLTAEDQSMSLLELVEGFFEYYLGFPMENKAASIWRGKPIDRKTVYSEVAQEARSRSSKHTRSRSTEQGLQSSTEETDEEATPPGHTNGRHNGQDLDADLSESGTATASEESTITEDEELRALFDKLGKDLRKLGIEDEGPSFEVTMKGSRRKQKKRHSLAKGSDKTEVRGLPAMQEMDALEQMEEAGPDGTANTAHKGLEAWQACPETKLFPIPPLEDPESFVDPPTWTQQLVVQDPFIHTRNTTMNIAPQTVSTILKEMQRALDMVRAGEPLDKICSNLRHDPAYQRYSRVRPDREQRRHRAARPEQKKETRARKPRTRNRQRAAKPDSQAIGAANGTTET